MTLLSDAIFGGSGYGYGWSGMPIPVRVDATPDPDAKAKPSELVERPYSIGSTTWFPGFDDAPPLTLGLLWRMRRFSGNNLAFSVLADAVRSGARDCVIVKLDGDDATSADMKPGITGVGVEVKASPEDKIRSASKAVFEPLFDDIFTGAECLNYGAWDQEVKWGTMAWGPGKNLTVPTRFIDFELGDVLAERVRRKEHNREFAGVDFNGNEILPPYVLSFVWNQQYDLIDGVAQSFFALESWWRIYQVDQNTDRLQRKPTGINMLIEAPMGSSFVDEKGQPLMTREGIQEMFNALSSGGAAVVPRTPFRRAEFTARPELLDYSAVKATPFDWSSTGPDITAAVNRKGELMKEVFRAWGLPERAITEATLSGSRADSGQSGERADAAAVHVHRVLLDQLTKQTYRAFLVTNWGPKTPSRFRWKVVADEAAGDAALDQQLLATLPTLMPNPLDIPEAMRRRNLPVVQGWTQPNEPPPDPNVATRGDPTAYDGLSDEERKVAESIAP